MPLAESSFGRQLQRSSRAAQSVKEMKRMMHVQTSGLARPYFCDPGMQGDIEHGGWRALRRHDVRL